MTITQTVEIPVDRRLVIDVPREVPTGPVILTYTPAAKAPGMSAVQKDDLMARLQKLQGSLGKGAFGAMDGVSYQRKVRDEWDN